MIDIYFLIAGFIYAICDSLCETDFENNVYLQLNGVFLMQLNTTMVNGMTLLEMTFSEGICVFSRHLPSKITLFVVVEAFIIIIAGKN